mgnify:FL=1
MDEEVGGVSGGHTLELTVRGLFISLAFYMALAT